LEKGYNWEEVSAVYFTANGLKRSRVKGSFKREEGKG